MAPTAMPTTTDPEARRRPPSWAGLALGATAVAAVDLAVKALFVGHLGGVRSGPVIVTGNPSFALGVADAPYPVMLALMAGGLVVAGALMGRAVRRDRLAVWIPAAVLGGGTANLVDRAASGTVHDYLVTPWVVFNLADVALVVGLVGLLLTRIWSTPPARS